MRFNQLIRIFDTMGFLIHLLEQVSYDLRPFLFYIAVFIIAFAFFLSLIIDLDGTIYQPIGFWGYITLALRTIVGDFDFYTLMSNTHFTALFGIGWLAAMIRGYVIFMNFIISVISNSYAVCMSRMVAQTYQAKLDLIVEREAVMTERQL